MRAIHLSDAVLVEFNPLPGRRRVARRDRLVWCGTQALVLIGDGPRGDSLVARAGLEPA